MHQLRIVDLKNDWPTSVRHQLLSACNRFNRWGRAIFRLFSGGGIGPDLIDLYYVVRRDPWRCRTSPLEQSKYQEILSLLPPALIESVLEVGCAEGVFTRMLAPRATALLGIDSSAKALSRARCELAACSQVRFQELNIETEEPEGSFDLIVVSEVLYYLGSKDQIARVGNRMVNWLKPGGYLLLCHMRSQSDEPVGFPRPRWTPAHPGAHTVHGVFDGISQLNRLADLVRPLYRISLYRRGTLPDGD